MRYFRIALVVLTAIFMAYHTQIFISRIEPNIVFSWTASLVIEGFLISLALSKTLISRILIVPLFLVSVIAASASFIVQNERLLDQFFSQKRVIEQIQTDLSKTQKAYQFGQRYTTKTLQRERQLSDELRAILKSQNGDITLLNSVIFFVLVLIMQSVSVYTATTLKNGDLKRKPISETETVSGVSELVSGVSETVSERETLKQQLETTEKPLTKNDIIAELVNLKKTMTLTELSQKFGISKATLSRLLSSNGDGISDEVIRKISEKI